MPPRASLKLGGAATMIYLRIVRGFTVLKPFSRLDKHMGDSLFRRDSPPLFQQRFNLHGLDLVLR